MCSASLKGLQQSSPNLIKDALPPCLGHLFTLSCEWEEQSLRELGNSPLHSGRTCDRSPPCWTWPQCAHASFRVRHPCCEITELCKVILSTAVFHC